jgi:hypothetical protein
VPHQRLYKIQERRRPSLFEYITPERLDLIVNVPLGLDRRELTDGYIIRRRAIDFGVPLITNLQLAELLVKSLATKRLEDLKPLPYEAYVRPPEELAPAVSGPLLPETEQAATEPAPPSLSPPPRGSRPARPPRSGGRRAPDAQAVLA